MVAALPGEERSLVLRKQAPLRIVWDKIRQPEKNALHNFDTDPIINNQEYSDELATAGLTGTLEVVEEILEEN